MPERRTATRRRIFKQGTLAFSGGAIECTVRNISTGGAQVDLACPMGLPPSFTLAINTDQFLRRCHPVWRKETRIGVAFD
jgi:PilZ domain-containing protein